MPPVGQLYKRFLWGFFVEGYGGRINVPAACNKAMRLLADGTRTGKDVSASAGISVQTADLLADAMSRNGATAEKGWESLPDAVRFSAIKSEYYPVPTRDAWIMARLMAEGATAPGSAVRLPVDRSMRGLIRAGHVRREGDRFYLAGIGPSLAQGVLSTYPELGNPAFSQCGGARSTASRLVEMTAGLAPPGATVARRRRAHVR